MKIHIILSLILSLSQQLLAQSGFGAAENSCSNINVNNPLIPSPNSEIPKRATFKIFPHGDPTASCTGTLINRNTTQDNLGFYMVMASHCFRDSELNDPNTEYDLIFNFESPTSNSNDVPISNRGKTKANSAGQQINYQSISTLDEGFQYLHKTKLRLVANYTGNSGAFFGDFIMFEILKPIPPHFNVAFAGWYPGAYAFFSTGITYPYQYKVISHPLGDIKKKTFAAQAISITGSTTGLMCRTVTSIIDGVFRVFGGNSNTQSACRFFETQTVWLPYYSYGGLKKGSSGSSLLSKNDKILGTFSFFITGSIDPCVNVYFNKFRVAYYRNETKNTLNPSENFWVDQLGIDGSLINCYSSLNNLSGEYFAGKDYNPNSGIVSNNRTTLQSATTINTNGALRIHPGADYVFVSSGGTTLNPGFEIVTPAQGETRGIFEIKTGSCLVPRSSNNSNNIPYSIVEKAKNLQLPKYKPFNLNLENTSLAANNSIQVFPNPNDGDFTIRFKTETKGNVELSFTDILGRSILKTNFNTIQGENFYPLNFNEKKLQAGIYFIILTEGENKRVEKVVIK